MNIQQINTAIAFGVWTNEDLNAMADAVQYARKKLATAVKFTIKKGDLVQYRSGVTGRLTQGTVRKVAIKYATVEVAGQLWRVPMNMLTLVDKQLA